MRRKVPSALLLTIFFYLHVRYMSQSNPRPLRLGMPFLSIAVVEINARMSRVREYSRQRDAMDMECEVAQRVLGGTNRAETQSTVSGLACSSYGSSLDGAKSDFRLTAAQLQ